MEGRFAMANRPKLTRGGLKDGWGVAVPQWVWGDIGVFLRNNVELSGTPQGLAGQERKSEVGEPTWARAGRSFSARFCKNSGCEKVFEYSI